MRPGKQAADIAKLKATIKDLRRWKREALEVLNELDEQAIADELELRVGDRICRAILPGIKRLKKENAKLTEKLLEAKKGR